MSLNAQDAIKDAQSLLRIVKATNSDNFPGFMSDPSGQLKAISEAELQTVLYVQKYSGLLATSRTIADVATRVKLEGLLVQILHEHAQTAHTMPSSDVFKALERLVYR